MAYMTQEDDPLEKKRVDFARDENQHVFVMVRYAIESPLNEISNAVQSTLKRYGLLSVLAKDMAFDQQVWSNVQFCMDHSRYGIAVFERLVPPDFNPNIFLELGYMLALRKPCLILKEKSLQSLPTNMMGARYEPFDSHNAASSVSKAIEEWLKHLGHSSVRLATTITGSNAIEASKERTRRILEALTPPLKTIRQAASLSSLAISEDEAHDDDTDGSYHELLLQERDKLMHLLRGGSTVRIIICPDAQIETVELGLVNKEYVRRNMLPRYDRLERVIRANLDNGRLQLVYAIRLPHDNLLVADDLMLFIGRHRRRDRGFPYTTQIFDPAVLRDEISEFDASFADAAAALLGLRDREITEEEFGSADLKNAVLAKLKRSKSAIQRIVRNGRV